MTGIVIFHSYEPQSIQSHVVMAPIRGPCQLLRLDSSLRNRTVTVCAHELGSRLIVTVVLITLPHWCRTVCMYELYK